MKPLQLLSGCALVEKRTVEGRIERVELNPINLTIICQSKQEGMGIAMEHVQMRFPSAEGWAVRCLEGELVTEPLIQKLIDSRKP